MRGAVDGGDEMPPPPPESRELRELFRCRRGCFERGQPTLRGLFRLSEKSMGFFHYMGLVQPTRTRDDTTVPRGRDVKTLSD